MNMTIQHILNFSAQNIVPISLSQIFIVLLLVPHFFRRLGQELSKVQKTTWIALAILIVYAGLCWIDPQRPFMFGPFLEDTASLAKDISRGDVSGYANYRYGIFYPYILSLFFKTFGVNLNIVLALNSLLFLANIGLVFIFSYLCLENEFASVLASLAYAINPLVLKYAAVYQNEFAALTFLFLLFLVSLLLIKPENNLFMAIFSLAILFLLINTRAQMAVFIISFFGFLLIGKKLKEAASWKRLSVFFLMLLLCLVTFVQKSDYITNKTHGPEFVRPAGENAKLSPDDPFSKMYPELSLKFFKNNFRSLLKEFPFFWLFAAQFLVLANTRKRAAWAWLAIPQVVLTFGYLLHGAYFARSDYKELNTLILLIPFLPFVGWAVSAVISRSRRTRTGPEKFTIAALLAAGFVIFFGYPNALNERLNKDPFVIERLKQMLPDTGRPRCIITLDYMDKQRWSLISKDDHCFLYAINICGNLQQFHTFFKNPPKDPTLYYNNALFDIKKSAFGPALAGHDLYLVFQRKQVYGTGGGFTIRQKEFILNNVLAQNHGRYIFTFDGHLVFLLEIGDEQ